MSSLPGDAAPAGAPTVATLPSALTEARVAVVGASGFIGTRLIEILRQAGARDLRALARSSGALRFLRAAGVDARPAALDVPETLTPALTDADLVVNLAYDHAATADRNVARFVSLLDAAEAAGVRRVVHASSIAVYDDWPCGDLTEDSPSTPDSFAYKVAKVEMEQEAARRASRLEIAVLQPTIVYGPHSVLWTDNIAAKMLSGRIVVPGGGRGVCNAVFVDDVVAALALAAVHPRAAGERFIVNGPERLTWRDFFSGYETLLGEGRVRFLDDGPEPPPFAEGGAPPARVTVPPWPLRVGAMAGRAIGRRRLARLKQAVLAAKGRVAPQDHWPAPHEARLYALGGWCSAQKARDLMGFEPVYTFEMGLEALRHYWRGGPAGRATPPR